MPENKDLSNKQNIVNEKLEKLKNKLKKGSKGILEHLLPFIFINGFLFVLNMTTSPGYPWFLFPLGGWGIGLVSHLFVSYIHKKQLNGLERIPPDINENQLGLIKKIYNLEAGLFGHIGPFLSTNAFLFLINFYLVKVSFPWFVFPLAGWGFGLIMHFVTTVPKLNEYRKMLKESDFDYMKESDVSFTKNMNVLSGGNTGFHDDKNKNIISQAMRIKNSLLKKIESNPDIKNKINFDIEKNISDYIEHIRQLILRDGEISGIIGTSSLDEIEKQIQDMTMKYEQTGHENLKDEYKKSIDKFERHKKSFEELLNQKEMIRLKITSSVMSLKQLEFDIANMKEITAEENYSLRIFEEQSEDLNRYVDTLKSSYQILKRELE